MSASAPVHAGMEPFSEAQTLRASLAQSDVRNSVLRGTVRPDGYDDDMRTSQVRASHQQIRVRRSRTDGRTSNISDRIQPLDLVFRDLSFVVSDKEATAKQLRAAKQREGTKWYQRSPKVETKKKVILNELNGMFRAGQLTAIMGPSGAGKTSLLDAVAGNLMGGQITGKILVNGQDYSGKKIKEISGFVFQDDVLLDTMTVREAIEQAALLRLPKSVSREERKRRVEDILTLLHLEGCQNTIIGSATKKGISGGERKRCCTGMELIANPPMLFLDEPTSGLDTFTAFTVIKSLKKLARRGRTVVATIHQPSSEIFHLFDDLMLLAAGHIIYYGPAQASMDYFARMGYKCPRYSNPADFYFMEVLRQFDVEGLAELRRKMNPSLATQMEKRDTQLLEELQKEEEEHPEMSEDERKTLGEKRVQHLIEHWRASPERQQVLDEMSAGRKDGVMIGTLRKRAPLWTQFKYLFKRASKNALRNPLLVGVQLFKAIFLGVLVGLIYLNSNQYTVPVQIRNKSGAIYFLALNTFFSSAFGVLTIFYTEKQVFFREYKAGYYTTTAYYWSKFLVEMPYAFIFPYLMVLIAYYMIGLNPPFSDYLMSATFVAVSSIAGVSLGMLIASIFDDLTVILAVTPAILLPLLLLSGIFVNSQAIPVFLNWIKYLSPLYYASVGMLQVEFGRDFPNCDSSRQRCDGGQAFDEFGLSDRLPMGVNLVLEITLWIALSFAAYFVLAALTRLRYSSS